ncbi:MAG: hypothetical protein V3V67_03685 [Myxococcota bacterium]
MRGRKTRRQGSWLAVAVGTVQILAAGGARGECGPYEDETRTSHRELRWGDFQGQRPERVRRAGRKPVEIAHVATTISYYTEVATRREGTDWIAEPADLCVQAFMLKDRSGYKRERRTRWDLDHEQGHFDITHYFAESLHAQLAQLEQRAASESEAQDGLLERLERERVEAVARWRKLQARYDQETRHSQRKPAQRRWRDEIGALLETLLPTQTGDVLVAATAP